MKYSKAGILKKKIGPASDVLQEEAKRMEEKLSELKEFMQKEKEKRDQAPKMKDGSKWRSAATTKPISGYADLVLTQKGKVQTKPKPQAKKEEYLPTSALLGEIEEKPQPQIQVKKDEVLEFLTSCGMEKYHKVFIDNGIEEIEILLELTEGHLANMNIPLGHRLKILKKIKDSKGKENTYKPLEIIPHEPQSKTHEMCVGDDEEIPKGDYNENDSYGMFKEAIEQFRNSGNPTKHKTKSKPNEEPQKKVRFLEPITEEMLPKEIKGMLYEGTWAPEQAALPETFEESSGTAAAGLIKDRKSCWNCYKIFSGEGTCKAYEKEFCSDGCVKLYYESRSVKCPCGNEFVKSEGRIVQGVWVCCEKCGDMQGEVVEGEVKEGDEKEDKDKWKNEEDDNEEIEKFEDEDEDEGDDLFYIDPTTGDPILKEKKSN